MRLRGLSKLRSVLIPLLLFHAVQSSAYEINLNGFGSAYLGQVLSHGLLPNNFSDEHVNFTQFSLIGLNAGSKMGDHLGAALQIVGLGSPIGSTDSFGLVAQWAYLTYETGEGTLIKAGRQLFPMFLASEYIRVAFLTPFRSLPTPVGDLSPFTRFDGISVNHVFDFNLGKLTLGIFGGSPLIDAQISNTKFYLADLFGAQAIWDGDGYRIRAAATRCYNSLTLPLSQNPLTTTTVEGHSQSYTLGYRFDKYNVVSWGEYGLMRTPDGTPFPGNGVRFAGTGHVFYLLGGYRIGNFLPRYTYSKGSSTYGIVNAEITVHTFGLNYQLNSQAVIKAEFEKTLIPSPGSGSTIATQSSGSNVTSGSAGYLGVDFIF